MPQSPNAAILCDAGRDFRDLVAVSLRLGEGRDAGVVVVDALSVVATMARVVPTLGLAEDRRKRKRRVRLYARRPDPDRATMAVKDESTPPPRALRPGRRSARDDARSFSSDARGRTRSTPSPRAEVTRARTRDAFNARASLCFDSSVVPKASHRGTQQSQCSASADWTRQKIGQESEFSRLLGTRRTHPRARVRFLALGHDVDARRQVLGRG